MSTKKIICLWSSPRNISTALMYSFAQRSDTTVIDEPLYGHYLRISGADHPGREEILASMETDGERAIENILKSEYESDVIFIKNMTHHFVDLDNDVLSGVANVFLIRDPTRIISSFIRVIPEVTMNDIGVRKQFELFEYLLKKDDEPVVIDSGEILKDPQKTLSELCNRIGISFDEAMLSWNPGPRPEDGIWAKHWYSNVHTSSGFVNSEKPIAELPEELHSLRDECYLYYNQLYSYSIKA